MRKSQHRARPLSAILLRDSHRRQMQMLRPCYCIPLPPPRAHILTADAADTQDNSKEEDDRLDPMISEAAGAC